MLQFSPFIHSVCFSTVISSSRSLAPFFFFLFVSHENHAKAKIIDILAARHTRAHKADKIFSGFCPGQDV